MVKNMLEMGIKQVGEGNHCGAAPGRTSYHLTKQKPILQVSLCSQQLLFLAISLQIFTREKELLKALCDFYVFIFF
jgi:hypothetical protein